MVKLVEIPADIGRVAEGLRDIGYTFPIAIADLIDNSIEANATVVNVQVGFSSYGDPLVTIADNGHGMDYEGLFEAMRYGAAEVDDPNRLGRFGLGLKTASTGFCRRLSLVATPGGGVPLHAAAWDIDLIAERGGWFYELDLASTEQADIFEDARDAVEEIEGETSDHGTLVIWEKVDRLLVKKHGEPYKNPKNALDYKVKQLREHLSLVFHRYIDKGDTRARNVTLAINGEVVTPWDPFCEHWADVTAESQVEFKMEDKRGMELSAYVRAFILPHKNDVADPAYARDADIALSRQGIYVYRENRLIEGPTWLSLSSETHLNQLRIELSYTAPLDEYFVVDVKKKDLKLDPGLEEALNEVLAPIRREADARARGRGRKPPPGRVGPRPTEVGITGTRPALLLPEIVKDGDRVTVDNNRVDGLELVNSDGQPVISIRVDEGEDEVFVRYADSLRHAVLWEPSLGKGPGLSQVTISTTHDWYQKAYLPNSVNSPLVQAIDYLFFALAQAEMNNTDLLTHEMYEQFRVEVSRNLNRLVADLPEPDPEP